MKIVIDTDVLFTALRSSRGASYKLVSLLPSGSFSIAISVPLIIEYEDVLRRGKLHASISEKDISDFDYENALRSLEDLANDLDMSMGGEEKR